MSQAVGPPLQETAAEGVMPLRVYLEVLRRRWISPAACALAAVAAAAWVQARRPDFYTAEVLLQRHPQRSPLDPLAVFGSGVSPDVVASEIEILRSRSVLAPVVDSLGLRLRIAAPRAVRSRALAAVHVSADAPAGRYLLARADGRVVVRDARTGAVAGEAGPDGWVAGPGFRLRPAPEVPLDPPLRLEVLLEEAALGALRDELRVQQVRGTALIRASYTSPDSFLAAAVVNVLADSYRAYAAERAREAATRRREFIEGQVAKVADSLAAAQQVFLRYQERSRTLDPSTEESALATALMDAESDVGTLHFHESLLESLLISLRSGAPDHQAFQRVVALGDDLLPGGAAMYGRLQDLEVERMNLTASRYGYTAADPRVERVDSLIAAARADVRGLVEQSRAVVHARREAAEARVRELRAQVGELPARAAEFMRLQQRVDAIQSVLDMLVEKYHEAQIAEAAEAGDVELVDAAAVPVMPDPRGTVRTLVFALLLGLFGGAGLAFVLDHLDASVRDSEDAERAAGLRTMGVVPRLPRERNGVVPVVVRQDKPLVGAEAFRVLRTTLRFAREVRPKLWAVSSPAVGEGKTTVAVNFALSLAQEGARVLVVDADMRRPAIHRALGLARTPGLADVLVGEAELERAAARTAGAPTIDVLPAGTSAPHPAELLSGASFPRLLQGLRERYDAVVIDAPPVLMASEATVIGRHADAVLVVARAEETDRRALAHAVEQLRHVGVPILGLVLNDAPRRGAYSGYYYYYYRDDSHDGRWKGVGRVVRRALSRFPERRG